MALKIGFIGGGNMASCIFKGIVKTRPHQDQIMVSGPHLEKLTAFKEAGAELTVDNVAVATWADVLFLGVKPQILPEVLEEIKSVDFSGKLVVSMAAGWRLSAFYSRLGEIALVRIMPNTPAKLGLGVTAVCPGAHVSDEQTQLCLELLAGLGKTVLTDEEGINSLGALAGSTPAFLYRFLEALVAETVAHGFSESEARAIIEQMALGTASMVIANQDQSLAQLREAVTSKGGTTFQGLAQMTNYHFEDMMHDVIEACLRRTREFEDMFK